MPTISPYDVIIVGAGPVGLLLSCELRLAQCSVLVLEQAGDPHSPLKQAHFGIRGLTIPSLEALRRRGLLEAVTAPLHGGAPTALRPHWLQHARRPGGPPHPLVGRSAPDFALADGSTLAGHLQTGQGLLLDFGCAAPLRDLSAGWQGHLRYIARSTADELGLQSLLVRPDGIVAWVGDGKASQAPVATAIQRWFGQPLQR